MLIFFTIIIIVMVSFIIYDSQPRHSSHRFVYPDNKATNILGPPRKTLPNYLRKLIYNRANRQCENPFCRSKDGLEIHHIDMNHNNNKLYNLIALCPNCHTGAHSGKYSPIQVHNWMSMDYNRLLQRQPTQDSSIYTNR